MGADHYPSSVVYVKTTYSVHSGLCVCVKDVFRTWKLRLLDHGFKLSDDDFKRLTNIRYADDILLFGMSLLEIEFMLSWRRLRLSFTAFNPGVLQTGLMGLHGPAGD